MKQTTKIPLYFSLLVATAGALFVVLWVYGLPAIGMDGIYASAYREASLQTEAFADRERDVSEQKFLLRRRELQILSSSIGISTLLTNVRPGAPATVLRAQEKARTQIDKVAELAAGAYQHVYLYDLRSRRIMTSTDLEMTAPPSTDAALLLNASQPGLTESMALSTDPQDSHLTIANQVLAYDPQGLPTGEVLAILIARIPLKNLLQADEGSILRTLGKSGALLLFDAEGKAIASTAEAKVAPGMLKHIAGEVIQGSDGVKVIHTQDRSEYVMAFRLLHIGVTEGLTLVTLRNTDDALHVVRAAFIRLSLLGLLVFAFSMFLMLKVVKSLVNAESTLRAKDAHARAVLENIADGVVTLNSKGIILSANPAMERMFGYRIDQLVDSPFRLLVPAAQNDASALRHVDFQIEALSPADVQVNEVVAQRLDGQKFPLELVITEIEQDGAPVFIGRMVDISDRKKAEEKIIELAFYDQVTGLPNRTLLNDRLKQAKASNSRLGNHGAVLIIDLDHFKTVNDTLGHDQGDELLKLAAQRLKNSVRDDDTVARFGGDEFVILLSGLSTEMVEAAKNAEVVGEKILASLRQPYALGDNTYSSTASIGITLFSDAEVGNDLLMKQADLAMYRSKESGRDTLHFFDPVMETSVKERVALERDLRQSIQDENFTLHYQGQFAGGQLIGAEVLVRWLHPLRGMVSPAEFIPLAEETGLIVALGRWVMATGCAQLVAWSHHPVLKDLTIAVNVSAYQFVQPDFVEQVTDILQQTGADPTRLKLELTESVFVTNVEDVIQKMHALKAKGVGFSLDDFGTGYSSLSNLSRLPLDQLKIDQSFVRNLLSDAKDASIVKTIIALASNLGIHGIAEGVETVDQQQALEGLGCMSFQGYLHCRPLTLEHFEAFSKTVLPHEA